MLKVAVWGTGNVGRPAIRSVLSHKGLELSAVIVSNPDKVGKDAGEIGGIDTVTGIKATDNWEAVLKQPLDAMVYTSNVDTRGEEAFMEVIHCLSAGVNIVSGGLYPLLYPKLELMKEATEPVQMIAEQNNVSVFSSGIDPGWIMDTLPLHLTNYVSDIQEVRIQEIFNYAVYDQPQVVREIIGFGQSMEETPQMLEDDKLKLIWGPMVAMLANGLGVELDDIETFVERRPLEQDVNVDGMGLFEKGTQGAFRFEVRGMVNGVARFVAEHITRIDQNCASDWPYPPEGDGCHQVIIKGNPDLTVSVHGHDPVEPGAAGGGNSSAANRLVNAIPAIVAAKPGIVSAIDLLPQPTSTTTVDAREQLGF